MSLSRFRAFLFALLALLSSCGDQEVHVVERIDELRDKEYATADFWQEFDRIAGEVRTLVELDTGIDLHDLPIRLVDREAMAEAFESNLRPQMEYLQDMGQDLAATSGQMASALLGIYHIADKEVLLCQRNFAFLADVVSMPELDRPDCLKAVMIHEVAHAVADRRFDLRASMEDLDDAAQLAGLSAVIEGYAQYLARGICTESGLLDGFETFTAAVGAPPDIDDEAMKFVFETASAGISFQYYEGEDFVRAVVEAEGEDAIAGMFEDPPISHAYISHPSWYLDPSLAEKGSHDLEAYLDLFDETFDLGVKGNQVELNGAMLRAAMAPLPEADLDVVQGLILGHRVNAVMRDFGNKLHAVALYECRSPADAASMADYSGKLLRLRDKAFEQGPTRITASEYSDFEVTVWRGIRADKTMDAGGAVIDASTIILTHGIFCAELSIIGDEVDVETIHAYFEALAEAIGNS